MRFNRFGRVLLAMVLALAGVSARGATTNYAGLVYSGSPDASTKAGIFDISVSANRHFTGHMTIGGRSVGFSSRFDATGAADFVVKITVIEDCAICDPGVVTTETHKLWNVHFQLSPGGESLSGGIHFRQGGFPDGTISAKRSSFNGQNKFAGAGKFTFVFAGSGDAANTNFPTGNGFGTASINSSGKVHASGMLADRSTFSESTLLCDDGTFPVYAPFFNGKAMIQGWAGLTNGSALDVTGDVVWVKPDVAGRTFYPAGFTNDVPITGSRYAQSRPLLNWTNGVVIFQGGKLSSPFTNFVTLNSKGVVVNLSENQLALKIDSSTGRFSGTVTPPAARESISFSGVLLQNVNGGFGFFPDAPLSGAVMLGPAGL